MGIIIDGATGTVRTSSPSSSSAFASASSSSSSAAHQPIIAVSIDGSPLPHTKGWKRDLEQSRLEAEAAMHISAALSSFPSSSNATVSTRKSPNRAFNCGDSGAGDSSSDVVNTGSGSLGQNTDGNM